MATQAGGNSGGYAEVFRYDVFISYAHGPRDAAGRGPLKRWSHQFRDLLETNLEYFGIDPARIFFDDGARLDERLDPHAALATQFGEELAASAMLQVHVSPPYLKSEWCGRELAAWTAALPRKPGGPDRRISLIRVGDTADAPWPEALAPGGTQLPGVRFHDEGVVYPWGWNLDYDGAAPTAMFSDALTTTAAFLAKRIKEIQDDMQRRAAEARQVRMLEGGTAGVKSVYLHGRERESALWQRTADDLRRLDVEVRPFNPAPDDDEGQEWESLSKVASRCEAMLLVGGDRYDLDADLDVVGRDRRNYIQAKFRKFLPCAVIDRANLGNAGFVRAAQLRGIDWLDAGRADWGDAFRSWLGDAAQRAAAKYGLDPV